MDHKNVIQSSVSATGLFPCPLISVCSGESSGNWSQTKFRHVHKHISSHRQRKFRSKFCSIPAIQIKRTCYYAQLFHILSNKQRKCLTSHFASRAVTLSLGAEFLSFCCCTKPWQKHQQRRGKWKSLSLHSAVPGLQQHRIQLREREEFTQTRPSESVFPGSQICFQDKQQRLVQE